MGKVFIGLILGSLITLFAYRLYQSYPNIGINPGSNPGQISTNPGSNLSRGCQSAGGKWLGDFKECEWTFTKEGSPKPESVCRQLNGSFSGCASPCRHQPGYPKVACLAVCTMVCKF